MSIPFNPTQARGLFFDIYATLIDWESGIYPHLLNLLPPANQQHVPPSSFSTNIREHLLHLYAKHEKLVEHGNPTLAYPQILERVYEGIAAELREEGHEVLFSQEAAVAFGQSIGDWPAFADTIGAMQALAKHYKLFVLSNVDNASFARTCAGPLEGAVRWDGIYTAEDIGSYKPDPRNYEYVAERAHEDFGIAREELVLVAQSLDMDHVAATTLGFTPGVWINRGGSAMGGKAEALREGGKLEIGAEYTTLGEFAEAVDEAFGKAHV